MNSLTEQQIAALEQGNFEIARDENGAVVSVTRFVEPPPLVISDSEYVAELFNILGIMRVVHAPVDDEEA